MRRTTTILAAVLLTVPVLAGTGGIQIKELIKIFGVGLAVREFDEEIDNAFDDLTNHEDTATNYTKVVPIITIGIGARGAIGAAQVTGARRNVERVKAVASPELELFGEIHLRALIPVTQADPTRIDDLDTVEGVGVSGIVDLDL